MKYFAEKNKYFLLYSHNILIPGYDIDLIYNLNTYGVIEISKTFKTVLNELKVNTLAEILSRSGTDIFGIVENYLDFLLDNDLGFFTTNPQNFPKYKLDDDAPYNYYALLASNDKMLMENILDTIYNYNIKFLELTVSGETNFLTEQTSLDRINCSPLYGLNLILEVEFFNENKSNIILFIENIKKPIKFFIVGSEKEKILEYKYCRFYFITTVNKTQVYLKNKRYFKEIISNNNPSHHSILRRECDERELSINKRPSDGKEILDNYRFFSTHFYYRD